MWPLLATALAPSPLGTVSPPCSCRYTFKIIKRTEIFIYSLQRALGMGGHVKYSGGQGKLAKAAAAASSGSQSVSAIGQV